MVLITCSSSRDFVCFLKTCFAKLMHAARSELELNIDEKKIKNILYFVENL